MAGKTFDLSAVFRVIDRATGPVRRVSQSIRQVNRQMQKFTHTVNKNAKAFKKWGDQAKTLGSNMSMFITLPIAAFGAQMVHTGSQFQSSMNMAKAVTNATGEEIAKMREQAKQLGATTQFSATQAAEGMVFLGKAGLSVKEVMDAMPKTLELAASAQLDMASAGNIVTNIMSGMKIKTTELARVNDVLVNAFTNSNVDLLQLGEAMGKVGSVASTFGFSLEETTAALGLLGNNAIQGTAGGTALRRIMTLLHAPTKANAKLFDQLARRAGMSKFEFNNLSDAIKIFEKAQKNGMEQTEIAEKAMKLFGDRGGPAFLAILGEGSDKLDKFNEKLKEQGTSARVAQEQMKGISGALTTLGSAWQAVQQAILDAGLGDFLEGLIRGFSSMLQWVSTLSPWILNLVSGLSLFLAIMGPILVMMGAFAGIMAAISIAGAPVFATMLAIAAGVAAVTAAVSALIAYWDDIKEFFGFGGGEEATKKAPAVKTAESLTAQTQKLNATINVKAEPGTKATIGAVKESQPGIADINVLPGGGMFNMVGGF